MRVVVTGDRYWSDDRIVHAVLDGLLLQSIHQLHEDFVVIEGGARGADKAARVWRRSHDAVRHVTEKADWEACGTSAGPIRNRRMIDDHDPDFVVAFHDDLSASKGTKDCVSYAKEKGVPVYRISHG